MIEMTDLRDSVLNTLEYRLASPGFADELLAGLAKFLQHASADNGGADTDRIYTTAILLTNANVWKHIGADQLVHVFTSKTPTENCAAFIDGLPEHLAMSISRLLSQAADSSDRAPAIPMKAQISYGS